MVTDQEFKKLELKVNEIEKTLNKILESSIRKNENHMMHDMEMAKNHTEKSNRKDITEYEFEGKLYRKRHIVRAVIKDYVREKGIKSSDELGKVFPFELQGNLGTFRKKESAEIYNGAQDRFFFGDEDILHFEDGDFVISKDWSKDNINGFLRIAEKLGYKITIKERIYY